jgi:signal transduction histidine kinase
LNNWIQFVKTFFFFSVPETLLGLILAYVAWKYIDKKVVRKIVIFSFIYNTYSDFTFQSMSLPLHFTTVTLLYFLLFFFIFKSLTWLERIKISVSGLILMLIIELIFAIISQFIASREFFIEHVELSVFYFIPLSGVVWYVAHLLNKKRYHSGQRMYDALSFKQKRHFSLLFSCLAILVYLLITLIFRNIMNLSELAYNTILTIVILTICSLFYITFKVISQTKNNIAQMTQEIYIPSINEMFTVIRGQRHDFLNHVQVIFALVQSGEHEELERYIEEVSGAIIEVNDIVKIGDPAIAALIRSKIAIAVSAKINFKHNFKNFYKISGVKSIDIVKIIGNLIDNAFDEVKNLDITDRFVDITSYIDNELLVINVTNNVSKIPTEKQLQSIFKSGYTTKKDNHSGLGLSIIKERTEFYKGNIICQIVNKNQIMFKIEIPM